MGDYEWVSSSKRTLVLVGRTGNGKSTTGNSILGKNAFKSARQSSGVTETCELQEATMKDGLAVAVIDTPGLFDSDAKSNINVGKEIVKCIDLARDDGIDAFLVVLSAASRFSDEEDATIRILEKLFDNRIYNYMILVFTGGDDIPSLPHYLGSSCPEKLKKFIFLCRRRVVLFDNKTTDENKKAQQVGELLSLVDDVLCQNSGQPFTNLKRGAMMLHDSNGELNCSNFLEMSSEEFDKLRDNLDKLEAGEEMDLTGEVEVMDEKQLAEDQSVRLRAEETSREAQLKLTEEIEKMRDNLEEAIRKLEQHLAEEHAQMKTGDDIEGLLEDLRKLNEVTGELEKELLRVEKISQAQKKLSDEVKNLRENLGQVTPELEMSRKCFSSRKGPRKRKTTSEKLL